VPAVVRGDGRHQGEAVEVARAADQPALRAEDVAGERLADAQEGLGVDRAADPAAQAVRLAGGGRDRARERVASRRPRGLVEVRADAGRAVGRGHERRRVRRVEQRPATGPPGPGLGEGNGRAGPGGARGRRAGGVLADARLAEVARAARVPAGAAVGVGAGHAGLAAVGGVAVAVPEAPGAREDASARAARPRGVGGAAADDAAAAAVGGVGGGRHLAAVGGAAVAVGEARGAPAGVAAAPVVAGAVLAADRRPRRADTVLAGVALRAGVAVAAARPVGGVGRAAHAARRVAGARGVALVERRAHDRVAPDARAGAAGVGPRAGVAVAAARAVVVRVLGRARHGVAGVGGAGVVVVRRRGRARDARADGVADLVTVAEVAVAAGHAGRRRVRDAPGRGARVGGAGVVVVRLDGRAAAGPGGARVARGAEAAVVAGRSVRRVGVVADTAHGVAGARNVALVASDAGHGA